MKKILLSVVMLLLSVQTVYADELADSLKDYCEKMKQCAKAQMSAEDMQGMPEGMLKMMEQSLNSMCDHMVDKYEKAAENQDLYEPALACYQSMGKQSCETLHDETAECKRFGKLAEKYDH
ncbi:MAG: hypothetical protein Q9N62_12395 [Ghiorsea sp.]|nr:hypothetical protein [Ghiorsea sp.]